MKLLAVLALLASTTLIQAQDLSYEALNNKRINTNKPGMLVLAGWGVANLGAGITGYATAEDVEWQSFHGMNALWGAVNGTIGILGYMGARKEAHKSFELNSAFERYQQSKKIYLINAGLDVLYIATGAALVSLSPQFNNPARWRGFGKSIAVQGVALLVFDGVMFGLLQQHNKDWAKLLSGVQFTGNGVGYVYRF